MINLPVLQTTAVIRKPGVRDCVFGLPISIACRNAGNSVDHMTALEDVDKPKRAHQSKSNRRVYVFHQEGTRCKYADKIVEDKDIVHCDYGDGGEGMSDFPIRPNPYYPRIFHGIGQYGLYSYPMGGYVDNYGAVQAFGGIYSEYSSTGKVIINNSKTPINFKNDKLAADLSINEDSVQ